MSNSIGEGILEEEEDEEAEEESNKKRMKEDDQEVQALNSSCTRYFFQKLKEQMKMLISSIQMKKESFFTWRVDLSKTEKYWEGWFRGLSALFLTCPVPKLLLLAGEVSVSSSELVLLLVLKHMKKEQERQF